MKAEAVSFDINGLHTMLESMSKVLMDFSENAMVLFHSSTTQIDSDEDLEKRIELMDTLMDMAEKEDDIAMVYAHTISDRIAEYEENIEMPKIPAIEMLKGLMDIKNLKQKDLSHIAPQSVISEILKGKREINLKQAKGFAEYFNIPIERFIN
ncbi:TPA: XRE family transcriptional regulator [Vibrio parahaemolyticus]|uniref:helix-turn-helix domain-containing protein n=1 Tax=Vibrio parahaemolyticus TaxID=670 RepID=UPI003AAD4936|nr:XRE family transcriptional regulator [Vibrio parahaemolyticus]HCG7000308.1 XRE family transcriptional regulator [Vibrio parahaemolyticus]HCG7010926.1 XRE family transcriptional regulator [Vibrio parahaemolyticus]HCG7016128.1 XRE family transcriptional regulator [Vibrio parahaemolyticus]HCG7021424.1 XRE family transcriptional regulator [Vibrio parahaemolyticus]